MTAGAHGTSPEHRVVVGFDGSDNARNAVTWAAETAARSGAALEIHTVSSLGFTTMTPSEVKRSVRPVMDAGVAHAGSVAPGVPVTAVMHEGSAAKALVEASRGADLLVVGSRGLGGFKGLLLGSVSQQCCEHAECPVVVVRPSPGG